MRVDDPTTSGPTAPDALSGLCLDPADRDALARQGVVVAEYRSCHHRRWGPYFKLRWRRNGRQQVRYLGRDPARAELVRAALAVLRRPRRLARQLAALLHQARAGLARAKVVLAEPLAERGYRLHGYRARRSQPLRQDPTASGLGAAGEVSSSNRNIASLEDNHDAANRAHRPLRPSVSLAPGRTSCKTADPCPARTAGTGGPATGADTPEPAAGQSGNHHGRPAAAPAPFLARRRAEPGRVRAQRRPDRALSADCPRARPDGAGQPPAGSAGATRRGGTVARPSSHAGLRRGPERAIAGAARAGAKNSGFVTQRLGCRGPPSARPVQDTRPKRASAVSAGIARCQCPDAASATDPRCPPTERR